MTPDRDLVEKMRAAAGDPVRWAFLAAMRLLRVGRASLLLLDESDSVLKVVASVGIDPALSPSIHVPLGEGVAGLVAARGMTLYGQAGDATYISVPIVIVRGVAGVLNVTEPSEGPFTAEDIASVQAFAAHIAHLIELGSYGPPDSRAGFPGRQAFEEMLERELARSRRTGSHFAVILLGFPDMGAVRERLADSRGQDVVLRIAENLKSHVRRYDFVARYTDDTFALLVPGVAEAGSVVARRLTDVVADIAREIDIELRMGVGLAHCPTDSISGSELLNLARDRTLGTEGTQHVAF